MPLSNLLAPGHVFEVKAAAAHPSAPPASTAIELVLGAYGPGTHLVNTLNTSVPLTNGAAPPMLAALGYAKWVYNDYPAWPLRISGAGAQLVQRFDFENDSTIDPGPFPISELAKFPNVERIELKTHTIGGDANFLRHFTSLTYLDIQEAVITYTTATLPSAWDALTVFKLHNNSMSQAEVDAVLGDLDTMSTSGSGTITITGTNAAPSAAGLASKTSLEGKGWTVSVTP